MKPHLKEKTNFKSWLEVLWLGMFKGCSQIFAELNLMCDHSMSWEAFFFFKQNWDKSICQLLFPWNMFPVCCWLYRDWFIWSSLAVNYLLSSTLEKILFHGENKTSAMLMDVFNCFALWKMFNASPLDQWISYCVSVDLILNFMK